MKEKWRYTMKTLKNTNNDIIVKQVIRKDELPFEVTNPKPSNELLDALKEGEDIIKKIRDGKRKGYNNVNEMLRTIIND